MHRWAPGCAAVRRAGRGLRRGLCSARTRQASPEELRTWLGGTVGLQSDVACSYAELLVRHGYDSRASLELADKRELVECRIRAGHAALLISQASSLAPAEEPPTEEPPAEEAPATVEVPIEEARATTAAALRNIGWDEADAALQAEVMTAAELCGNNQGLVKMYQPELMAPAAGAAKPTVERETASSAVVNANQSPGMLAATLAADLAAKKAQRGSPIAIVAAHNTSTSSGQLAFYAERIARQGLVGICLANSPEFVAAAKGGSAVYGTNPVAFGIPRAGGPPLVFDMATSAIALFGVLTAKAKGEPLPAGVAYGADGEWTLDAAEALEGGAIATFGGHKGAGLALCVEILAGAMSGGAVLGQVESKKAAKSWGHTIIAIDPSALVDGFADKAAAVMGAVKASGPGIRLPGEASSRIAESRRAAGTMPIPDQIWASIQRTAGAK